LRGIARRSAVVNAVPLHTTGAALGEWFGTLADGFIISRLTPKEKADATPPVILSLSKDDIAAQDGKAPATSFEAALEPVARRMERIKLPAQFLRDALVPGATVELNALAMQWAGMPNKNERAALREALDALAAGGYLEPLEDETWKVTRGADA
jgi:hypothetical protein